MAKVERVTTAAVVQARYELRQMKETALEMRRQEIERQIKERERLVKENINRLEELGLRELFEQLRDDQVVVLSRVLDVKEKIVPRIIAGLRIGTKKMKVESDDYVPAIVTQKEGAYQLVFDFRSTRNIVSCVSARINDKGDLIIAGKEEIEVGPNMGMAMAVAKALEEPLIREAIADQGEVPGEEVGTNNWYERFL